MVLGRNGLRDERRRRALIDENLHAAGQEASSSTSDEDSKKRARAKAYAEAAHVANHAPVSVCIPKRPLSVLGLFAVGVALIAAIEVLYVKVFLRVPVEFRTSLPALDVTARGSLASWFSSVVLCCSAMASLLVFLIRRHRMDDYRGRYRWWLWLVPLLLAASVNAGTGLHQALSGVLTSLSGAEVAVGGKGWWLLAYAAVFLPIVLQLAIEFWPSRLATAFFCGTVTAYLLIAAFELQAVQCATPLATAIAHSTLLLAAPFGVLLSILSFGRYVYLDAHGKLKERRRWRLRLPRRAKAKRTKRKTDTTVSDKNDKTDKNEKKSGDTAAAGPGGPLRRVRVDGAHSKFGQSSVPPPKVTVTATSNSSDDDTDSDRPLSKHERKKLRREGLRQ